MVDQPEKPVEESVGTPDVPSGAPSGTESRSEPGLTASEQAPPIQKPTLNPAAQRVDAPAPVVPLYTQINSPEFDLHRCLKLLRDSSDNIAIQYEVCRKVMTFPMAELRFFVPQFLQLLITVDTQSLALEEMIKVLCSKDVHFSLLTFWYLQAFLQQLGAEPESIGFQTCKRLINELQYQLFNYYARPGASAAGAASSTSGVVTRHDVNQNFRENLAPALILQTSLFAGTTVPEATEYVAPIVKIQGKRVKTLVFEVLRDVKKSLTENLTKKNTLKNAQLSVVASASGTSTNANANANASANASANSNNSSSDSVDRGDVRRTQSVSYDEERVLLRRQHQSQILGRTRRSDDLELDMVESYADINLPNLRRPKLKHGTYNIGSGLGSHSHSGAASVTGSVHRGGSKSAGNNVYHSTAALSGRQDSIDGMVSSMPDLTAEGSFSADELRRRSGASDSIDGSFAASIRNSLGCGSEGSLSGDDSSQSPVAKRHVPLTSDQQVKILKSNYFKNATQFVIALQNISIRLSKVPREARLSTLKAELSVLNKDLPCEVDIPILLPKNKRGKLHKLCHIAVNESVVLNSAERVPYLLLIEYFSDGMDFDPSTSSNKKLLKQLEESSGEDEQKYRFDLAYGHAKNKSQSPAPSSGAANSDSSLALGDASKSSIDDRFEESDLADVSVVKLKNRLDDYGSLQFPTKSFLSRDRSALDAEILDVAKSLRQLKTDSAASEHDKNLAVQMRIAGIMLQQLESGNSMMPAAQAEQIRSRIVDSMESMQNSFEMGNDDAAGERKLSNDLKVAGLSYLGEDWQKKKERIRKQSKYGHYENWDLCSVIAKTGDDLSQEAFACQLIQTMANMWYGDSIRVWAKRMRIIVTSSNTGLVETITDALSVHSIKKSLTELMIAKGELQPGEFASLKDHFLRLFGDENSPRYQMALRNFASSLAAYSIICYVLQIKDRHNGNIMLDAEGHIVHIDFGFLLSNSPGSVGFESAPFKLTQEYVDLLGGVDSTYFEEFKTLTKEAFKSVRRHADQLVDMVELMQTDSPLPCFRAGESTSIQLKQRLQLSLTDDEADAYTENFLIAKSLNSAYTRLYDQFQMMTQGIYP